MAVVLALLPACGGSSGDTAKPYEQAVSEQEACCDQLGDDRARAECKERVVRVDPAAVETDVNRDTYRCVERHFVCDPASGMATQASAQAALDCISDLEQ